jgi:hypothetical protein
MDIVSNVKSKENSVEDNENIVQNNKKDNTEKLNKDDNELNYKTDDEISQQNIKLLHDSDVECHSSEEENIETISGKEAEARFLLWYEDLQCREEWYKRRIEELEKLEEKYKQTIATLKSNDEKLQQRYSKALIEIKVLRKKNMLPSDDKEFVESYISLSAERENLIISSRENSDTIKKLKKEMLTMRTRLNSNHARNPARRSFSTQTKMDKFPTHYSQSVKTETDRNNTLLKHQVSEAKQFGGGQIVRSKANFTYSASYSNENVQGKERGEQVIENKVRRNRQRNKESEPIYFPDIRQRPDHMMWI